MDYVSYDSSCLHRNKTHIHTDVNAYVYSPIHVKTKLLQDPNTSITKGSVEAPQKNSDTLTMVCFYSSNIYPYFIFVLRL